MRIGWEILSDYLEPDLSQQLREHLHIKDEVVKTPQIVNPTVLTGL